MNASQAKVAHSLPSAISIGRMLLLVPFVIFVGTGRDLGYMVAAGLMVVAVISDILDGFLARRLGTASSLGSFLDCLADKVLLNAVQLVLLVEGAVGLYVVLPLFVRDMVVDAMRNYDARRGEILPHNIFGKLKVGFQYGAILLALFFLGSSPAVEELRLAANLALGVALVFGVGSGVRLWWLLRQ